MSAILYDQSCDDIDSFALDIKTQIQTKSTEVLKDLTSVKNQQLSGLDN